MSWAYAAALVLVGAGLSLAFALLWLGRAARRRRHVLDELLGLRRRLEREPLEGLAESGALVERLGLPGLRWHGSWYGAEVAGGVGQPVATPVMAYAISQPDVRLQLEVSLRGLRGEARLFAEQAAQLLFAILDGALAARELALVSAMAQRARLAVFVQHDMRNLSQWVALVTEDLERSQTPDELLASARRLQQGAAMARDRAQRIGAALARPGQGEAANARWQRLDLLHDLEQAAAMHQVTLRKDAAMPASLHWDWSPLAWATLLDNVLGNISRLAREQVAPAWCAVRWRLVEGGAELAFDTPQLPLDVSLQHLFEPWSGASPGGSGLGLYQARRAVVAARGNLQAAPCETGLSVTLFLPRKNS